MGTSTPGLGTDGDERRRDHQSIWRQKETEDFRPGEDEENEGAYDERRKDEGHENGEVDHWAFQGTDDDEDDDGSFGDRHVCYFSDDEVGGGGYGSF